MASSDSLENVRNSRRVDVNEICEQQKRSKDVQTGIHAETVWSGSNHVLRVLALAITVLTASVMIITREAENGLSNNFQLRHLIMPAPIRPRRNEVGPQEMLNARPGVRSRNDRISSRQVTQG